MAKIENKKSQDREKGKPISLFRKFFYVFYILKGLLVYGRTRKHDIRQEYDKAIGVLTKALQQKKEPKVGSLKQAAQSLMIYELYIYRGVLYEKNGELEKAFDDFCEALAFMGFVDYANIQDRVNKVFDSIAKENPMSVVAYCFRGSCYASEKDFDKALIDYDEAIKRNPVYKEAYKDKIRLLKQTKRHDECLACMNKLMELEKE